MSANKVFFTKRDLQFANEIAVAEKYHLLSFSDGASSTDHLVRVVELENSQQQIQRLLKMQSADSIVHKVLKDDPIK